MSRYIPVTILISMNARIYFKVILINIFNKENILM